MCDILKKYESILRNDSVLRWLIENFDRLSYDEIKIYLSKLGIREEDIPAILDCFKNNKKEFHENYNSFFNQ
jgi:hypothetical protein